MSDQGCLCIVGPRQTGGLFEFCPCPTHNALPTHQTPPAHCNNVPTDPDLSGALQTFAGENEEKVGRPELQDAVIENQGRQYISCEIKSNRVKTIFGKSYVEYKVRVRSGPLAWFVYRRFSEFARLKKELNVLVSKSKFDRKRLPKFPKKTLFKSLDPQFVVSRKKELQDYISAVLEIDDVGTSIPVLSFLGALQNLQDHRLQNLVSRIYIDKYVEFADTGDIVLFHTQGFTQAAFRTATSSPFDHVGMVQRIGEALYLLEATGDGVQRYGLVARTKLWFKSGAKMVVRRLYTNRNPSMIVKLDTYIENAIGKKYGISPINMLRRRSQEDDTRTKYFCSELLAGCYKSMTILPDDVPSHRYMPATFSGTNDLKLLGDSILGNEILLDFVRPAVSKASVVKPSHKTSIQTNVLE